MEALSDKKIVDSWEKNVSPWIQAIQEKQIESRKIITDQTIIDAVSSLASGKVLDIGCGEGWLVRELSARDFSVTGIDAIKGLIDKANEFGAGDFRVLEYENISSNTLGQKYDIAVCNFSLLGKESVEHIFKVIPDILNDNGKLIIQTLHPHVSCGDEAYNDGWRKGTWKGFSDEFVDPAPWYFRTLEAWLELFLCNGLTLNIVKESLNPQTGNVASLLIVGTLSL